MSMSILSVSQVPAFTSVSPRHQLFNTGGTELCGILSLEQFAGNLVLSPRVISDVTHFTHVHRISSDFMFLFIVYFIVKYCTKCTNCSNRAKDPELIARQALDGTNRYRASKAGNISGPFQQIKLTHSEGPEQNPMNVDLFLVPKMLTPPMPTEKTWVISLCRVEGLPPLRWNDGIARIAREHAEQMASGAAPFSPIAATASTGFVPKWVFLTMVDLPGFTNKQYENYGENYHHIGFTRNGAINLNIRQAERNKCGTWRSLKKNEAGLRNLVAREFCFVRP